MIAIIFGTINVVGGFLVTDRMLEMFKSKPAPPKEIEELNVVAPPLASFLQDPDFIDILYIVGFSLFIYGLRGLTGPRTAVRGNRIAAVGMGIALVATFLIEGMGNWGLIAFGIVVGTIVGVPAARQVKMTAMPQMVALFNGVGGGAVALIAWAEFRETGGYDGLELTFVDPVAVRGDRRLGLVLGLEHRVRQAPGDPARPPDQRRQGPAARSTSLLFVGAVAAAAAIAAGETSRLLHRGVLICSALLGIFVVLPIGGADMPVVISLLNAFTGLSAAATGLALDNTALIVAGMIVGASGTILTRLMADAMNRSIPSIVAGGFGGGGADRGRRRAPASTPAPCARRAPPTSRSSSPTRARS